MKKIFILIILGLSLSFFVSATENKIVDNLQKVIHTGPSISIPESCICTMEFAPVCGELRNGQKRTFSNTCVAKCSSAKILYNGKCEKKDIKDDKKIPICTLEYAPVCGKQDENLITFGNNCQFKNAQEKNPQLKFLYKGECGKKNNGDNKIILPQPEKKILENCPLNMINPVPCEKSGGKIVAGKKDKNGCVLEWKCVKKNYNTGITGGIKNIKNKVPVSEINVNTEMAVKVNNDDYHGGDPHVYEKEKIRSDLDMDVDTKKQKNSNGEKKNLENNNIEIKTELEKQVKNDIGAEIVGNIEVKNEGGKKIYEVKTKKRMKFLGLFDFDVETEVKIDAKTNIILEVNKPWYSFLLF